MKSKAISPESTAFGQALRKCRIGAGLSQEKLAAMAEMHRNYIGDVERGEKNICLGNMVKLSRVLKIKLSELFQAMETHLE